MSGALTRRGPTAEDRIEKRLAAANRLVERLVPVLVDAPHGVAIYALLSLVRALGERHPCCTQVASVACAEVAAELLELSKNNPAPQGAHLH